MFLRAQDSSWPQARNAGLAQENPQQFIRTLGTIKNELPIISLNQDDVAPKSRSWGERYASNKWHFCKILSLLLLLHNFRELSHFLRAQSFEAAMLFPQWQDEISNLPYWKGAFRRCMEPDAVNPSGPGSEYKV